MGRVAHEVSDSEDSIQPQAYLRLPYCVGSARGKLVIRHKKNPINQRKELTGAPSWKAKKLAIEVCRLLDGW